MSLSTDNSFKNRTRRQRLTAIFLASLILLTGAAWYSTTKLTSKPVSADSLTTQNRSVSKSLAGQFAIADNTESQAPLATTAAFAPFLNIVPSQDGVELFISAAGVGELGGTVFANIDIGSGGEKGSWTMPYSGTIQAHAVTTVGLGLSTNQDEQGTISITTTLGLDTGTTDFNRAYVPAESTLPISSIDGNLQLTPVSTDTFPTEVYVAVVPTFGLPGPPPMGHRLVGSAYSVRASGAILVADRPMSLRLAYNDITLAGADPHTLAVFAWDAFNKRWDNLGGTLFSTQQYLSVATSRFTTYALMTTPAWRDEFGEFSGLDFGQFNNVTFGGTPENRTLVLLNTPGSGSAPSQPITPTTGFANWGTLTFSRTVDPPTTTLSVDVLSLNGSQVLTDMASGTDLAGLVDPVQFPSLRLRVNMTSTLTDTTPALERWELGWQVEVHEVYLPLVVK